MGKSRFSDNMAFDFEKRLLFLNQFYTRKKKRTRCHKTRFDIFLDLSDFVLVSKFKKGNFKCV